MSEKFLTNINIAFDALLANKLRSLLTALGVIFGVAAVIAMLGIINGSRQEMLDQIELVGVNNIVVTPRAELALDDEEGGEDLKKSRKKYSPGLTLEDAKSIAAVINTIEQVSPEVVIDVPIVREGIGSRGRLVGVEPNYFQLGNFELAVGKMFNESQLINGAQVCIIGHEVKTKFFSRQNPIGKFIKCGPIWLKVVGVIKERTLSKSSLSGLDIRNYNMDVYAPIQTVLIRVKNRSKVGSDEFKSSEGEGEEENTSGSPKSYHQLDRLTIKVKETEMLATTAGVVQRMLQRRHYQVEDLVVEVPELLLKQEQRTKDIFNWVLGIIAGISLLVGGIGIMNIMLASVLERIKEIGLRMAIGAKKGDIVMQFLLEAILISLSGGLLGVGLGLLTTVIVASFLGIATIVTFLSVFLSFSVSLLIGLVFGIVPAMRASEQSPINSLRYE